MHLDWSSSIFFFFFNFNSLFLSSLLFIFEITRNKKNKKKKKKTLFLVPRDIRLIGKTIGVEGSNVTLICTYNQSNPSVNNVTFYENGELFLLVSSRFSKENYIDVIENLSHGFVLNRNVILFSLINQSIFFRKCSTLLLIYTYLKGKTS